MSVLERERTVPWFAEDSMSMLFVLKSVSATLNSLGCVTEIKILQRDLIANSLLLIYHLHRYAVSSSQRIIVKTPDAKISLHNSVFLE